MPKAEPSSRMKKGKFQITIWRNFDKNGQEYKTFSLQKSYKKDDQWKNSENIFFTRDEIPDLLAIASALSSKDIQVEKIEPGPR